MTRAANMTGNEGETVASAVARRVRQELAGKPRRISQASIAEATGMTQQTLSARMTGKVEFGVEEITRVCAFADLDLMYVMTGKRMPRQESPDGVSINREYTSRKPASTPGRKTSSPGMGRRLLATKGPANRA